MKQFTAIAIVTSSIFLIPAISFSIYRFVRNCSVEKMLNEKYRIDTIIQTGLVKEALPTIYLAELLDLSSNKPKNFFTFDKKKATTQLLSSPLIKDARVEKKKPSIVYVDYNIRTPIAMIADFTNTAIDIEGYSFGVAPFFSPKKLPEIFLGLKELPKKIEGAKIDLALSLYKLWEELVLLESRLKKIDVSKAFHESYGKREIVLKVENSHEHHFLRLSTKNYREELRNYLSIKDKMGDVKKERGNKVIDMRIAKIAYIENVAND